MTKDISKFQVIPVKGEPLQFFVKGVYSIHDLQIRSTCTSKLKESSNPAEGEFIVSFYPEIGYTHYAELSNGSDTYKLGIEPEPFNVKSFEDDFKLKISNITHPSLLSITSNSSEDEFKISEQNENGCLVTFSNVKNGPIDVDFIYNGIPQNKQKYVIVPKEKEGNENKNQDEISVSPNSEAILVGDNKGGEKEEKIAEIRETPISVINAVNNSKIAEYKNEKKVSSPLTKSEVDNKVELSFDPKNGIPPISELPRKVEMYSKEDDKIEEKSQMVSSGKNPIYVSNPTTQTIVQQKSVNTKVANLNRTPVFSSNPAKPIVNANYMNSSVNQSQRKPIYVSNPTTQTIVQQKSVNTKVNNLNRTPVFSSNPAKPVARGNYMISSVNQSQRKPIYASSPNTQTMVNRMPGTSNVSNLNRTPVFSSNPAKPVVNGNLRKPIYSYKPSYKNCAPPQIYNTNRKPIYASKPNYGMMPRPIYQN